MSIQNPYSPAPPAPAPAPAPGNGLGVAALVAAVVAVLLAWIPVLNLFAALLAAVALVLGIVSVVQASRARAGKGLGIASIILSGVALVVAAVVTVATVVVVGDVMQSMGVGMDAPAEVIEAAADDAQVLPLGGSAGVGDFAVTVDAVDLDATREVDAVNPLNVEPDGQYVVADLSVTYRGDGEADAWMGLMVELVGSDGRIYDEATCTALLERDGIDLPALATGETGSYQVCFDVPAAAIGDAAVRVAPTFSFDDTAALWATK